MFSFRTTSLLEQPDLILKRGRIGLVSNQTSWNSDQQSYLYEQLQANNNLTTIFVPQYGLFGESFLADSHQPNKDLSYLNSIISGTEIVPLFSEDYKFDDNTREHFSSIDALIFDIQNIGSRYESSVNTLYSIFKYIKESSLEISVYIVDKINPATRVVQGTMLRPQFASSYGVEGIVHRYGLTIGELANLFYNDLNAKFPLHIISANTLSKDLLPWSIPVSEDMPGLFTAELYSGQCLWNGTNVSCAIGTTRPYEYFGAPFMKSFINAKNNWNQSSNPIQDDAIFIRWCCFEPQYGVYANQICYGFQILLKPGCEYHSLLHTLRCIKFVSENCPEFKLNANINSLLGDQTLLDYITGSVDWDTLRDYVKVEEQKWIRKAKKYLLYDVQPWRIK